MEKPTETTNIFLPPYSPERGVDLQRFAEHLGSDVVHAVPAQVDLSQAGVAAQGIDQHSAPRAQTRVRQGQRLQRLEWTVGKWLFKEKADRRPQDEEEKRTLLHTDVKLSNGTLQAAVMNYSQHV